MKIMAVLWAGTFVVVQGPFVPKETSTRGSESTAEWPGMGVWP